MMDGLVEMFWIGVFVLLMIGICVGAGIGYVIGAA